MRTDYDDNRQFVGLVVLLIIIKVIGLVVYGPIHAPDTPDFTRFADVILNESSWLHHEDLNQGASPPTSFRAIGYPLVIAFAKSLSTSNWPWIVIGIQLTFSLIATAFVYRLAKMLSGRQWVALFAALCHGVGQNVVLDQTIFTNSLNASLLLIMACHIGISVLSGKQLSVWQSATLGAIVLAAFLIREAGLYLQVFYWPLVFFWSIRSNKSLLRAVYLVAVFAAPTMIGAEAYKSWNEYRSGERYITTPAQVAMFFPALKLKWRGIETISKDPLLSNMEPFEDWRGVSSDAQIIGTRDEYMIRITNHMRQFHGYNHVEVARFLTSYFYRNWIDYPRDMMLVTLSNIKPKQLFLAFRPLETAIQLRLWATAEWPWPQWSDLWDTIMNDGDRRLGLLALIVFTATSRVVSTIILGAFFVGVPILVFREVLARRWNLYDCDPARIWMFLCLILYLGYTFTYALVSLELRYFMPVSPLAMIIGITLLAPYIEKVCQTGITKGLPD